MDVVICIIWWGLGYREFVVAKNLWKARFGNYWLTAAALICLGNLNIAIRTSPVRQHSGKAAVNPAGIGSESNSSWCIVNIKYMNRKGIVSFVACGKEHLFTIANTSCTVTGKFEFASLGCRILFDINWKVWPWSPANWVVELFKAEKQAGFFSHVNSSWPFLWILFFVYLPNQTRRIRHLRDFAREPDRYQVSLAVALTDKLAILHLFVWQTSVFYCFLFYLEWIRIPFRKEAFIAYGSSDVKQTT